MYQDITLKCKDCGKEFVFTAGEQEFYAAKGFQNQPQRCKECRTAKKIAANGGNPIERPQREQFDAICAECGKPAKIPFQPTNDRPVYCSDCYAARKASK